MHNLIVKLTGSNLSVGLQSLSHGRNVAGLSLFYKYFHAKCSTELADLVPPRRVSVRTTRFSERQHRYVRFVFLSAIGSFINPASFLALRVFVILSLKTAFHLNTILVCSSSW